MALKFATLGRVADARLNKVQRHFPPWLKRTLVRIGASGRFELACMGVVIHRVHRVPLRMYQSRAAEGMIVFEAWPWRRSEIGIMYRLITPYGNDNEKLLADIRRLTNTYPSSKT